MTPIKPEKLESIQLLRAVVALMILAFHMSFIEARYTAYDWLAPFKATGMYRVDLFFVISGFVLTYITYHKIGQRNYWKTFLFQRIWRICSLYWLVLVALVAALPFYPELFDSIAGGAADITGSFLLTARPENLLLVVGWTLTYELYFYVMFSVAFLIKREHFPAFLMGWVLLILILNLLKPFGIINPAYYFPDVIASAFVCEFISGCVVALCILKHMYDRKAAYLLYFFAVIYFVVVGTNMYSFQHPSRTPLMVVVCTAVVFSIILNEGRIRRLSLLRPVFRLGNASYSMYLIHLPVLALSGDIWHRFITQSSPVIHLLWIVVSIALVLITSRLTYRFVEKPLVTLGKKLVPTVRTA